MSDLKDWMKEGCISIESETLKVMEWGNTYGYAKNLHDSDSK